MRESCPCNLPQVHFATLRSYRQLDNVLIKKLLFTKVAFIFLERAMTNFYWPVYRNIEQEFINISNIVHVDDKQNSVYSVKIAELLLRCVVEIESISKDLYIKHGGKPPESGANLYFDTGCIAFLESKWLLSKKKVVVSSANLYFQDNKNKELFPLYKANKRGSSSADWARAYQAVKHNRVISLVEANIKHLIRAMAALYVLNIYYRDEVFILSDNNEKDFISNWSDLFNINVHPWHGVSQNSYIKHADFDESIYFIKWTDKYQKQFDDWNAEQSQIAFSKIIQHPKVVEQINQKAAQGGTDIQERIKSFLINGEWMAHLDIQKDYAPILKEAEREATQKTGFDLVKHKPKFTAILNKNQVA